MTCPAQDYQSGTHYVSHLTKISRTLEKCAKAHYVTLVQLKINFVFLIKTGFNL